MVLQGESAVTLARFMLLTPGFEDLVQDSQRRSYHHMGATVCDTMLQAGMHYQHVVAPRVRRILREWPSAVTASSFLALARRRGLKSVLEWKNDEKPRRIFGLAEFLVERRLETESDVARWIREPSSELELRGLRGFGPKTVDYLKMLVGVSTVPVDRHVRRFVGRAGIGTGEYGAVRQVVADAAELLEVDQSALDYAIWRYESSSRPLAA